MLQCFIWLILILYLYFVCNLNNHVQHHCCPLSFSVSFASLQKQSSYGTYETKCLWVFSQFIFIIICLRCSWKETDVLQNRSDKGKKLWSSSGWVVEFNNKTRDVNARCFSCANSASHTDSLHWLCRRIVSRCLYFIIYFLHLYWKKKSSFPVLFLLVRPWWIGSLKKQGWRRWHPLSLT